MEGKWDTGAMELLGDAVAEPVELNYLSESLLLHPQDVGFQFKADDMLEEVNKLKAKTSFWPGFADYIVNDQPLPANIPLQASYDAGQLKDFLAAIANEYDRPLQEPNANANTLAFAPGQPEQRLDIEASLPLVAGALNSATAREVDLVVNLGPPPRQPGLWMMGQMIEGILAGFPGFYSIYIKDLATGQEFADDADVAYAGMSILKIAIMVEAYKHLDGPPDADTTKILTETMTLSGNFTSNLLLRHTIGDGDAYEGVRRLNQTMKLIGLANTFMATPYDEDVLPQHITTPANQRTDVNTYPDPFMQTTPQDMGRLLEMIYQCANGGGTLIAAYPNELTPDECQAMLEIMSENRIGELIEAGVPEGTPVAHKHGWVGDSHGDAGIVFTPGGDYVLCVYLYHTDWLEWEVSSPLMARISEAAYKYFNR
ncbi:MAG: serine hydrolase [Chloroflexi bacterium]|nr:serine hydrolase [Chloroflexota bacterium]